MDSLKNMILIQKCALFNQKVLLLWNIVLENIAAWNIVANKGQGLPGSGAFDFALRLQDMACTSSRRKDVGGLWQWQHPPHSTCEAQRLRAIRGTAAPPLPYKYTDTARVKRSTLVWSSCEKSRRWVPHRLARGAGELEASWICGQPQTR